MNLMLLLSTWAAVFASFLIVTLLRWNIGKQEDDQIHLLDTDRNLVATQSAVAHKLDVLDRWKSILLTVVVVYGLAIAGYHLYNVWLSGATSHVS